MSIPDKVMKLKDGKIIYDDLRQRVENLNETADEKADKVDNATSGNFAALDGNGNLIDSGHKHSDYLTNHQDISGKANISDLATVATSGSYNDLTNKPIIPTAVSDLTDDSGHYTKPVSGIPASDLAAGVLDVWSGLTYHTSTMSTDSDSFVLGGATDAPTEINKCLVTSTPDANVIPKFDYQGRLHSITPEDEWDGSNAVATTEYVDNMISDNMPEIPTNVSELNNDAGYLTSFTETDPTVPSWAKASTKPTYTAAEVGAPTVSEMNSAISTAIGSVNSFDMVVVQELPTTNISTHTIYLVPKTGETNDVYDEYIYINDAWEMVGNTQIDLSNYATKNEIPTVPTNVSAFTNDAGYGTYTKPSGGIPASDLADTYVKPTDYATASTSGVVKIASNGGLYMASGLLLINRATDEEIKDPTNTFKPIVSATQHKAVFYGLAKAAGDATQKTSENEVGTYTDEAKAAIQQMLDVPSTSDISVYATKTDTVLETTLSKGRKAGTTVGQDSLAFGFNVEASGLYSIAFGAATIASGSGAYAEGAGSKAISNVSHAEGQYTRAIGLISHAEGEYSITAGRSTHAEGYRAFAFGIYSHSEGTYDNGYYIYLTNTNTAGQYQFTKPDDAPNIYIGDIISLNNVYKKITNLQDNILTLESAFSETCDNTQAVSYSSGAIGRYSHSEGFATIAKGNCQHVQGRYNIGDLNDTYCDIIGNGLSNDTRSNAYALDWNGNGYYAGDIYVNCNADSTGGTKLATLSDIPDLTGYITDTYYTQPGIAGLTQAGNGLTLGGQGTISISSATVAQIKTGTNSYNSIVPSTQNAAVFYGLAKAAGDATQSSSSNTVGTYTDTAKGAIQSMLGISNLLAPSENSLVASQAYSINALFTANGKLYKATSAITTGQTITCQNNGETVNNSNASEVSISDIFIKNTDYATTDTGGIVKVTSGNGINIADGFIYIQRANADDIKTGTSNYKPIVPAYIGNAVFYGLAAAAGDATQKASSNEIGTYTDDAKTAIRTMVGAIGATDFATTSNSGGTVKLASGTGITIESGNLTVREAYTAEIKKGSNQKFPIVPRCQHTATFYGLAKAAGDTTQSQSSNAIGTYTDDAKAAIKSMIGINVEDVQIAGTSVVSNGIAAIPVAGEAVYGVIKIGSGLIKNTSTGKLEVYYARPAQIKVGTNTTDPIVSSTVDVATFYGLAKAAGDATQSSSSNAVGTYTPEAQASIQTMLGISSTVALIQNITSTTPVITGQPNMRYVCGEVSTLSITAPSAGSIIVQFTSGTTPTVLTVTNNNIKWPTWFNPSSLAVSTTYAIMITDGMFGAVMTWVQ